MSRWRSMCWRALGGTAMVAGVAATLFGLLQPTAANAQQPAPIDTVQREPPQGQQPAQPSLIDRTALIEEKGLPRPDPTLPRPQNPIDAKAAIALEQNCVRCHQAGPAGTPQPQAGIGNIPKLDELARDPRLVRPGLPDGSLLYVRMLQRHPAEIAADGAVAPSVRDVEAVRDWIEALAPVPRQCKGRQLITDDELSRQMENWIEAVGSAVARDTRFVSLAPLANTCASEAELAAHRQALQKMFASLSWSKVPPRLEAVGDSLTLFSLRLTHLGWVGAHWERLSSSEPKGFAHEASEPVVQATGAARPLIRGDWLASAAMSAPFYYELLGLPSKLEDLAKLAGLELADALRGNKGRRAALRTSTITGGNRVVERFAGAHGPFWLAYDFMSGKDAQNVFEHPFGPMTGPGDKPPFRADATRVIFSLPNGMLAFAAYDADGRRIDTTVAAVQGSPGGTSPAGLRTQVAVGRSCIQCHASGARPATDQMHSHLEAAPADFHAAQRELLNTLYQPVVEFARQLDDDNYGYRRALVQTGIDPDLLLNGEEIITSLAGAYEKTLDLDRAAAELGVSPKALTAQLDAGVEAGGDIIVSKRLQQGTVKRAEAESLLAGLPGKGLARPIATGSVAAASDREPKPASARMPGENGNGVDIALWSDRNTYRAGDLASFSVRVTNECHLTIIDIDPQGKATVLFPNDFKPENLVRAGTTLQIPEASAPYQLRLRNKGTETVIAVCQGHARSPFDIEHDFERQRFTLLGNWRAYLNEYVNRPVSTRTAERFERNERGRGRRERPKAESRVEPRGPDFEVRSAIRIKVE